MTTSGPPAFYDVIDAPSEHGAVDGEIALEHAPGSGGAATSSALGRFGRFLLGLGMVVGSAVGLGWAVRHYALSTPRFAIDTVDVRGARRLTTRTVMEAAGIERGHNIFALDAVGAERRLVEIPWVEKAHIERKLPGTLVVELVEREAVAVTSVGGALYLVARSGEPFKPLEPGDPFDLPVITGLGPRDFGRDRDGARERLGRALDLVRRYRALPVSKRYDAEEVHLAPGGEAVLTVGKAGIALYLGEPPWQKQLLRAARVLQRMRTGREPSTVFADNRAHPERVVVRMR